MKAWLLPEHRMERDRTATDIKQALLALIIAAASDLPLDVQQALLAGTGAEGSDTTAGLALQTILQNVALARDLQRPMCQDTGTPLFFVRHPEGQDTAALISQIRQTVAEATRLHFLRPNAVDPLTGTNSGDNVGGEYFPYVHLEGSPGKPLEITLVLKGGGCENVGVQYSLPDQRLGAMRDLEGVYRAVMDAVLRAQGQGCAPGVLGVVIGGDRATAFQASKQLFMRQIGQRSENPALAGLEERLLRDANALGIGPMGFGGRTTLLDVFVASLHTLPASYFVTVSYMCWAYRRKRLSFSAEGWHIA